MEKKTQLHSTSKRPCVFHSLLSVEMILAVIINQQEHDCELLILRDLYRAAGVPSSLQAYIVMDSAFGAEDVELRLLRFHIKQL